MTPYWTSSDGRLVIYHGDCREILPSIETHGVLLLTDPPYGLTAERGDKRTNQNQRLMRSGLAACSSFLPVHGDDEPYDPTPLLRFPRLIVFGANYFSDRLPVSPSWLVWDKTAGLRSGRAIGFNDNADAELIWTNLGGPVRVLKHQWLGMMKLSERGDARVHPTQKPVLLMRWLIEMFARPDDLILDPYMGSGTTLVAAMSLGRRAVGIEYTQPYCDIAVGRLKDPPLFELIREQSAEQASLFAESAV